jgi:hypothetical protein
MGWAAGAGVVAECPRVGRGEAVGKLRRGGGARADFPLSIRGHSYLGLTSVPNKLSPATVPTPVYARGRPLGAEAFPGSPES